MWEVCAEAGQTEAAGRNEEGREDCRSTGEAEELRNRALAERHLRRPFARIAASQRTEEGGVFEWVRRGTGCGSQTGQGDQSGTGSADGCYVYGAREDGGGRGSEGMRMYDRSETGGVRRRLSEGWRISSVLWWTDGLRDGLG